MTEEQHLTQMTASLILGLAKANAQLDLLKEENKNLKIELDRLKNGDKN